MRRARPWFIISLILFIMGCCSLAGPLGGGSRGPTVFPGGGRPPVQNDNPGWWGGDWNSDNSGGSNSGSWNWGGDSGGSNSGSWDWGNNSGSNSGSWDWGGGSNSGSWDWGGGSNSGSWNSGGSNSGSW